MSATRVRRPSRYSGIAQPAGSADPDANARRRRAARSYCSIEIRDRDPISVGTTQGSKLGILPPLSVLSGTSSGTR